MASRTVFLNDAFGRSVARNTNVRSSRHTRRIDLERSGRETEPAFAVPSALKHPERINMSWPERFISMASGVGMVAYGVYKRSWTGVGIAAAGVGVIAMGTSGYCPFYSALQMSTAFESGDVKGVHIEEAITIRSSAEELYGFWRNFENHALISDHLNSVKVTGPSTSHWIAKGPADSSVEWDAEMINDRPNDLIAWQTLPGSDIEHAGSVQFKALPDDRGTEVIVTMQYYPPAGAVGAGLANIINWNPAEQTAEMLKRLKLLMETERILAPE